jgi:hypothetical protein
MTPYGIEDPESPSLLLHHRGSLPSIRGRRSSQGSSRSGSRPRSLSPREEQEWFYCMLCHFPRSNYFFAEQHTDGKHCKYYYNASQQLVDGPDRLVWCIPQGHSETCSNFFHPEHGFQYVCVECYDNGEDLPKWTPRSPTKGSSQADITQHEQNSQSEYQRTQESGYQPSQPLSEYGTGVNLDSSQRVSRGRALHGRSDPGPDQRARQANIEAMLEETDPVIDPTSNLSEQPALDKQDWAYLQAFH